MKNIDTLFDKCFRICAEANVPIMKKENISYYWTSRAKSRAGCCMRKNGKAIIEISDILSDDSISDETTENTILHELCHTVPFGDGHTGEWKRYAEIINRKYGYHISRCFDPKKENVEVPKKERIVKYLFSCTGCGQEISRTKKSKFTDHPERYRCGICGGSFKQVY